MKKIVKSVLDGSYDSKAEDKKL